MEKQEKRINLKKIITATSLFLIGWNFLAVLLALFGIFYSSVFWFLLIACVISGVYFLAKNFSRIKISSFGAFFLIASVILVFIFSFFTSPTVFSGRDQGAFSSAAIHLSESAKINFSSEVSEEFFKIYGPGKALNFPGYNYSSSGELITQFPLGYTSFLASFYSIFGLTGFMISNAVTFLLFLLSLFFISRKFFNQKFTSFFLALIASSFVFSWFLKFTLSENLALFLVWFGIWKFIEFWEKEKRIDLFCFVLSFGLLLFVRIETLALWLFIAILLFWKFRKFSKFPQRKVFQRTILIIGTIFIINLIIHGQSYWVFLKSALKPFILGTNLASEESFWSLPYILKVFSVYSLLPFLLVGILGIVFLMRKKCWQDLIPFFIISPIFLYLLSANISPDHPWMLRRFVFALIPMLIFYTVLFLDKFFKRKFLAYILIGILLVSNLIVTLNYITFSPSRGLLEGVEKISQEFQSQDLVLVDRLATGDPWAMMSGPLSYLFGIQAIYFPNPEDIDKIEKEKFDRIYLIIPNQNIDFYADFAIFKNLKFVKNYTLKYYDLESNYEQNVIELPLKKEKVIYGKIYEYEDLSNKLSN